MVSWLAGLDLAHTALCYLNGDKTTMVAIANQENQGFRAKLNTVTHYVHSMMKEDELRYLPFEKVFLNLPSDAHLLQQMYIDPDESTIQNFLVDTKTRELRVVADSLLLLGRHDNRTGLAMMKNAM